MALPFDAKSQQAAGEAFPVVPGTSQDQNGFLRAAASQNGVLLYLSGSESGANNQFLWFDRAGKTSPAAVTGAAWEPAIFPDEKSFAYSRDADANSDIWLRDLIHGVDRRLTSDRSQNNTPVWSPKGDQIVFRSTRSGTQQIYWQAVNGVARLNCSPRRRKTSLPATGQEMAGSSCSTTTREAAGIFGCCP